MQVRGDADVISIGCSPIIWGSLVHGIVRGLWDSMTARSKERHTYVGVYKADIINACKVSMLTHPPTHPSLSPAGQRQTDQLMTDWRARPFIHTPKGPAYE